MYVRHAAWLSAVPDKAKGDKSEEPGKSRLEQLKADGKLDPEMPPTDCEFMVGYLYDIGPTMGDRAISYQEIESWQRNTGVDLDSWQARTLHRLSVEYLVQAHNAKRRDCPPPWAAPGLPPVVSLKTEDLKQSLRALANL